MAGISAAQPARAPNTPRSEPAIEVSVVMPCLNEAETLADCIAKAQQMLREHGYAGEVVIADNGSTDGSQAIAEAMGARVVPVAEKGYGSALMGGIAGSRGRFIVMGDADRSYDFGEAPRLIEGLRSGCDLVMGNRFRGGVKPNAMPHLHRYLGNPVLTWIGRLLFKAPCADFHCGLRAFSREAYQRMDLRTTGMEFASEMVVKAALFGMRIGEEPVTLSPDGRSRPPHLRSWRDGWRHLRFLLLYSPRWLFLYPGAALFIAGLLAMVSLVPGNRSIGGITFGVHTLLYAGLAILVGAQAVAFAALTKIFAISERLLPPDRRIERAVAVISIEAGLLVGALLVVGGLAASVYAVNIWAALHFGNLVGDQMLRVVIPAATSVALGVQIVLFSYFMGVLGMGRR